MYKKTTLKNGLRIITVPMKSTQAVTILVLVGAGSKYETKETNGISHFLEHMFGKGTKKRPSQLKVFEDIDKMGGKYDFGTSKELNMYVAKVHLKFFDFALDWLSDVLLNSKLAGEDIDKERKVILEEINHHLDLPALYIWDLWETLLYGDQPAGWPIIGTKENILNFKREDFLEYSKKHYSSEDIVICVAGKIGERNAVKKIEKYFSKININTPLPKQKVTEKQEAPQCLIEKRNTDQTHICVGAKALDLSHPLRYGQELLAIILGGCSSSRLLAKIRTQAGLAYWVYASSETYTDSGYLLAYAGVSHKNAERAIKLILEEYRKIKKTKVEKSELQKAKDYLKGRLALSLETSDVQASFYAEQELLEQKILTPEQVFKKIDAVTSDDIIKVARDIFKPEKLNLALIGPFKNKQRFQRLLKL